MCCSVLQCVAGCCNVLQCVAGCCNVLQYELYVRQGPKLLRRVLQFTAVYYSVSQRVAMCYNVWYNCCNTLIVAMHILEFAMWFQCVVVQCVAECSLSSGKGSGALGYIFRRQFVTALIEPYIMTVELTFPVYNHYKTDFCENSTQVSDVQKSIRD